MERLRALSSHRPLSQKHKKERKAHPCQRFPRRLAFERCCRPAHWIWPASRRGFWKAIEEGLCLLVSASCETLWLWPASRRGTRKAIEEGLCPLVCASCETPR